jgi:hypothetical protein
MVIHQHLPSKGRDDFVDGMVKKRNVGDIDRLSRSQLFFQS